MNKHAYFKMMGLDKIAEETPVSNVQKDKTLPIRDNKLPQQKQQLPKQKEPANTPKEQKPWHWLMKNYKKQNINTLKNLA